MTTKTYCDKKGCGKEIVEKKEMFTLKHGSVQEKTGGTRTFCDADCFMEYIETFRK